MLFYLKNLNTIRIIAHSSNDLERTLEGEYIMVNEVITAAQTFHCKLGATPEDPFPTRFNVEFEAVREKPNKLLEPETPSDVFLDPEVLAGHGIVASAHVLLPKVKFARKKLQDTHHQTLLNDPNGKIYQAYYEG